MLRFQPQINGVNIVSTLRDVVSTSLLYPQLMLK